MDSEQRWEHRKPVSPMNPACLEDVGNKPGTELGTHPERCGNRLGNGSHQILSCVLLMRVGQCGLMKQTMSDWHTYAVLGIMAAFFICYLLVKIHDRLTDIVNKIDALPEDWEYSRQRMVERSLEDIR